MDIKRKVITLALTATLAFTGICASVNSIKEYKVNASTKVRMSDVDNAIEGLYRSIRRNYLGVKNVPQWEAYIRNARYLNNQLSNSYTYTKSRNNGLIDKAEVVVNSVAKVNQIEKSMEVNAHVMKNIPTWEYYMNIAKEELEKIDKYEFRPQYEELLKRSTNSLEIMETVRERYYKTFDKVETMYYDAVDLVEKDSTEALIEAKKVKELALKLQTHNTSKSLVNRIHKLVDKLERGNISTEDKTITSSDNLRELNRKDYRKVTISTGDDFYNKRISNLKANTLEIKSGRKLILENCEVDKLIIGDNNDNLEVEVEGTTVVERTTVKSGGTISRSNSEVEDLRDTVDTNFLSIGVNTTKKVYINAVAINVTTDTRKAVIDIGGSVDFLKVRNGEQNIIVSKNGVIENLLIDVSSNKTIIEGTGKVLRFKDDSKTSIILLKN